MRPSSSASSRSGSSGLASSAACASACVAKSPWSRSACASTDAPRVVRSKAAPISTGAKSAKFTVRPTSGIVQSHVVRNANHPIFRVRLGSDARRRVSPGGTIRCSGVVARGEAQEGGVTGYAVLLGAGRVCHRSVGRARWPGSPRTAQGGGEMDRRTRTARRDSSPRRLARVREYDTVFIVEQLPDDTRAAAGSFAFASGVALKDGVKTTPLVRREEGIEATHAGGVGSALPDPRRLAAIRQPLGRGTSGLRPVSSVGG